jgi:uncharacterized coiled-coil DUF342 family protein
MTREEWDSYTVEKQYSYILLARNLPNSKEAQHLEDLGINISNSSRAVERRREDSEKTPIFNQKTRKTIEPNEDQRSISKEAFQKLVEKCRVLEEDAQTFADERRSHYLLVNELKAELTAMAPNTLYLNSEIEELKKRLTVVESTCKSLREEIVIVKRDSEIREAQLQTEIVKLQADLSKLREENSTYMRTQEMGQQQILAILRQMGDHKVQTSEPNAKYDHESFPN